MITNLLLKNTAVIETKVPVVISSRCSRMRTGSSSCRRCLSVCPQSAIKFDEGLEIIQDRCDGCLMCTAECPTGALEVFGPVIEDILKDLKSSPFPVLGCSKKTDSKAHARVPCLGMVSYEYLLILTAVIDRQLQINLTECSNCNENIPAYIHDSILCMKKCSNIEDLLPVQVTEKKRLVFSDSDIDRRVFFHFLKDSAKSSVNSFFDGYNGRKNTRRKSAYSSRELPVKLKSLNDAFNSCNNASIKAALKKLYFSASVKNCNFCGACAGACPDGAIKIMRGAKKTLEYTSSRCCGCKSCVDLCPENSIKIRRLFKAESPFHEKIIASKLIDKSNVPGWDTL